MFLTKLIFSAIAFATFSVTTAVECGTSDFPPPTCTFTLIGATCNAACGQSSCPMAGYAVGTCISTYVSLSAGITGHTLTVSDSITEMYACVSVAKFQIDHLHPQTQHLLG
jgi:hypothetical protein